MTAIRFPKMHIAASVSNRILNIADGLTAAAPIPEPDPILPDIGGQSDLLDAQLNTPPGPAELPAGADGAVVGAALTGEPLVDAVVNPAGGTGLI